MPNIIQTVKKGGKWVAVGATAVVVSTPSFAFDIPAEATAAMNASIQSQVVVGGLILVAAATAFGIRWVKATFFG